MARAGGRSGKAELRGPLWRHDEPADEKAQSRDVVLRVNRLDIVNRCALCLWF